MVGADREHRAVAEGAPQPHQADSARFPTTCPTGSTAPTLAANPRDPRQPSAPSRRGARRVRDRARPGGSRRRRRARWCGRTDAAPRWRRVGPATPSIRASISSIARASSRHLGPRLLDRILRGGDGGVRGVEVGAGRGQLVGAAGPAGFRRRFGFGFRVGLGGEIGDCGETARAEAVVGLRGHGGAGAHLRRDGGVGERGVEGLPDLAQQVLVDGPTPIGRERARAAGQRTHRLLPLTRQGPQVRTGQVSLRVLQRGAEVEQRTDFVRGLARQQVHHPRTDRGLAQLADPGSECLFAGGAGRGDPGGAGGDELGRVEAVQVVANVLEVHAATSRRFPRRRRPASPGRGRTGRRAVGRRSSSRVRCRGAARHPGASPRTGNRRGGRRGRRHDCRRTRATRSGATPSVSVRKPNAHTRFIAVVASPRER